MAEEKFTGFANTVSAKGKSVDARKVSAYDDDSELGRIRSASQGAPSSILDYRTEGPSTNGAPMAQVPGPDIDTAEGQGANES